MGPALKPKPGYTFPRPPSEPSRPIDSPYWANPSASLVDGQYHIFLVENFNRYANAAQFLTVTGLVVPASHLLPLRF